MSMAYLTFFLTYRSGACELDAGGATSCNVSFPNNWACPTTKSPCAGQTSALHIMVYRICVNLKFSTDFVLRATLL
jgi:hypothetical protein